MTRKSTKKEVLLSTLWVLGCFAVAHFAGVWLGAC